MPEETLGYVELEWNCRNCGATNPGTKKTCHSCGAAMSEDQAFALPENLVLEPVAPAPAEGAAPEASAPDIHCGYCGARNIATRQRCSQCGGDLAQGAARVSGRIVSPRGSKEASPLAAAKGKSLSIGCLVLVGLLMCAGIAFATMLFRTSESEAVVQAVQWERTIAIMEQRAVEREN
jgi:hypothetical protein